MDKVIDDDVNDINGVDDKDFDYNIQNVAIAIVTKHKKRGNRGSRCVDDVWGGMHTSKKLEIL